MATPHFIAYKSNGQPSHCAAGKKGERMAEDIAKAGMDYRVETTTKDKCPICNRTKVEPSVYPDQEPVSQVQDIAPYRCQNGCLSRPGQYRLKYMSGNIIRFCKDCGGGYDVTNMKPWEDQEG